MLLYVYRLIKDGILAQNVRMEFIVPDAMRPQTNYSIHVVGMF